MAIPSSNDARLYYRCAFQRFEEAEVLFSGEFTTGAIYLAGYGIECMLKALILTAVPAGDRNSTMKSFRSSKAHDFGWLRDLYLMKGGARFPTQIMRHFALVNEWSTEIRYTPKFVRIEEAEEFLKSAMTIMSWANGRL